MAVHIPDLIIGGNSLLTGGNPVAQCSKIRLTCNFDLSGFGDARDKKGVLNHRQTPAIVYYLSAFGDISKHPPFLEYLLPSPEVNRESDENDHPDGSVEHRDTEDIPLD